MMRNNFGFTWWVYVIVVTLLKCTSRIEHRTQIHKTVENIECVSQTFME